VGLCRTKPGGTKLVLGRLGIDEELAAAAIVHNLGDLGVGGLEAEK
jgi:hypothetical protein